MEQIRCAATELVFAEPHRQLALRVLSPYERSVVRAQHSQPGVPQALPVMLIPGHYCPRRLDVRVSNRSRGRQSASSFPAWLSPSDSIPLGNPSLRSQGVLHHSSMENQ